MKNSPDWRLHAVSTCHLETTCPYCDANCQAISVYLYRMAYYSILAAAASIAGPLFVHTPFIRPRSVNSRVLVLLTTKGAHGRYNGNWKWNCLCQLVDARLKADFPTEVGKGDVAVWLGTLPLPRLRSTLISHEHRFGSLSPDASRRQCARSSQVNYRHYRSQLPFVGFHQKEYQLKKYVDKRDSSPIKGYCKTTLNQPVCDWLLLAFKPILAM